METTSFTCSINEWYLAKIYMELEQVSGKSETIKRSRKKGVLLPAGIVLSTFLLGMLWLQGNNWSMHSFVFYIIFIFFLIGVGWLVIAMREYRKIDEELLNPPSSIQNKEILLYEVSDEGIKVNFYNNKEYVCFFKWEDFQSAIVEKMQIKPIYHSSSDSSGMNKGQMKRKLNARYRKTIRRLSDFPYEKQLVHDDKRSISFLHRNSNQYNILPIPPSWERNGETERFFDLIRQKMGHRFLEEGEAWDLLETYLPNMSKFFKGMMKRS